jgi:hypothetical protein
VRAAELLRRWTEAALGFRRVVPLVDAPDVQQAGSTLPSASGVSP